MTTTSNETQRSPRQMLLHLVARARALVGQRLISIGQRVAGSIPPSTSTVSCSSIDTRYSISKSDARSADPSGETSADRFANLASMIPGVVYQRMVTPDGDIRYTYMSEGAREVFGVSPEEVMANPEALFQTYSDDYKANFRSRLIEASRSLTKWDVEASIVGPDGNIRYTHAIAKPEQLPDGSVLWTGLILDATRIKQAEEELKAANRIVEAATQAKSMFLANMSHEIRTPMNGVLGMADLLLKTELMPRQHRLLSTLKNSAQTLLGIINDVLDISRIEAGRFHLESEGFELRRCLEEAIDLCAGAAYQKGLELNLIVDGELPHTVKGDSTRLRQVLINLIGNAVKFTEVGDATLRASSVTDEDGKALITIDVIDTGIGIDDAAKQRLFAPFTQADSSISRRFGGTGLGLAITRHLVELMGGRVELASQVGSGTRVSVQLTLDVVDAKPAAAADPIFANSMRILVVDDRERVRDAVASMLKDTGARVDRATGADEAQAMLLLAAELGDPYAIAIVDRLKPGADSIDVCRRIVDDERLASLHVINIVSMNWRGEQADTCTAANQSMVAKPLRRDELLSTIEKLTLASPRSASRSGAFPATDETEDEPTCPKLGMQVLLVEDNPVNQEVAREYLTALGCIATVASNGKEAVDALAVQAFDIVLMDCQMPVLDGLSASQIIREREAAGGQARQPIIAVTANAYESDRVAALAAGMDDYLAKPFTDTALLEILRKWQSASPLRAPQKAA